MLIFEKIRLFHAFHPFLAFFSDCIVDFEGPISDTFSYVFPIYNSENGLKQL